MGAGSGWHPFGNHGHGGCDRGKRLPLAESGANLMIAAPITEAGHHEIADSAQAAKGLALATHRRAKTRHLRKGAGDERRLGILAETEPVGDAGRDGEDILERTAKLDAPQVTARVGAEGGSLEERLDRTERWLVGAPDHAGGGDSLRDLPCEIRPGEDGQRGLGKMLREHLAHEKTPLLLDPLGAGDKSRLP